jgi:hypothetical protein
MNKITEFLKIMEFLPLLTFYPKWAQFFFLGTFILVLISILLFVVLYQSASSKKAAAPAEQLQSVSVSSKGNGSPAIGIVHGNVIVQYSPTIPLEWKDAFKGLPPRKEAEGTEPFATRTFSILRERGATFILGPCPSNRCMIFELGDFREQEGVLVQEILLDGEGFGIKRRPEGPESNLLLQIDRPMRVRGASLGIPFGAGKMSLLFGLHRDSIFEMFTSVADIRIITSNLSVDRLELKLEIRPPSNFRSPR